MNWINENKEWLFSGIGVSVLLLLVSTFRKKKSDSIENVGGGISKFSIENSPEIKTEISITNNVSSQNDKSDNLTPISAFSTKEELELRKKLTNILFVDDETKFKIIKILNVAGWINTKIVKDIENPDSEIVTKSHILFIDINGVGIKMHFKDEGLGLANYLKKKYPEKKVILYSTEPNGDRFHEAFRKVDDFLNKNADPIEFQEIIEQFSAEIKLT